MAMGEPCDPSAPSGARVAEIDRRLRALREQLEAGEPAWSAPYARERPFGQRAEPPPSTVVPTPLEGAPPRGRAGPLADALARARALAEPARERARASPTGSDSPSSSSCAGLGSSPAPDAGGSGCGQGDELAAALLELHGRLADALGAYRQALDRALSAGAPRGSAHGHEGARASLHAGPFVDPPEVRFFQLLLEQLRVVEEVRLIGYEGRDRAVLEVRLRATADPQGGHSPPPRAAHPPPPHSEPPPRANHPSWPVSQSSSAPACEHPGASTPPAAAAPGRRSAPYP